MRALASPSGFAFAGLSPELLVSDLARSSSGAISAASASPTSAPINVSPISTALGAGSPFSSCRGEAGYYSSAAAADGDRAHDRVANEKQRELAADGEGGHHRRPGRHAEIQRDDDIQRGGGEHQGGPHEAENRRDVTHELFCGRRQIAVHPSRLEHHHADDDI